jgi:succinate dehydrogenase flavin-adding protein (antitoxin of CptAB toxin-antitoxin module)
MNKFFKYFSLTLLLFSKLGFATVDGPKSTLNIKIYDPLRENETFNIMVIKRSTNTGFFADPSGVFSVTLNHSDTLMISARGYKTLKISVRDSVYKESYDLELPLYRLSVNLKEVSVSPLKSFDEISDKIKRLGYTEQYSVYGLGASIMSPITFLYERFSKFEKRKRDISRLENEMLRREVLQDLFRRYVNSDIISLNEDEFDDFIQFMNLSDEFILTASQYDLTIAIKNRYEAFKNLRKYYQKYSNDEDYYYDE